MAVNTLIVSPATVKRCKNAKTLSTGLACFAIKRPSKRGVGNRERLKNIAIA